jgi:hypothetical protein
MQISTADRGQKEGHATLPHNKAALRRALLSSTDVSSLVKNLGSKSLRLAQTLSSQPPANPARFSPRWICGHLRITRHTASLR